MYRVLLVDEDPHIQTANEVFLREMGYQIYRADHGAAALDVASTVVVDAVVLDAELPNLDGVPICRQLRERYQVPIIFLSRHTRADNHIRDILTAGDDSLEKPYSLAELERRLRLRIQRHHKIENGSVLRFGDLKIDLDLEEVRYKGQNIWLTALEFHILAVLAQNPNRFFSCEQLYDLVGKSHMHQSLHDVRVCAARTRQKLESLCPNERYMEAAQRRGYCFCYNSEP